MRARIAQCLCPKRHAIMAMAVDEDPQNVSDDEMLLGLRQVVAALIAGMGDQLKMGLPRRINPWCDICKAPATRWRYDVQWTKEFSDWETAQAALRDLEARQLITNAILSMVARKNEQN